MVLRIQREAVMFIDEEVDPASLPQRDGKPVPHGEEIAVCGTCRYCKLRLMDKKTPYAACTEKVVPGSYIPELSVTPTGPEDDCEKWESAHPIFNNYEEQLSFGGGRSGKKTISTANGRSGSTDVWRHKITRNRSKKITVVTDLSQEK